MFVGLIELMLEFVKPVTLSMRLFGNIYGGEVALRVITALTLFIAPVLLLSLEVMLNFIQALIFSILSLLFIVLAVESHEGEEGEMAHEAMESLEEGTHGNPARGGLGPAARNQFREREFEPAAWPDVGGTTAWITSALGSRPSGSSAPASASASWEAWPQRRSGATRRPPARSAGWRSSWLRLPKDSACWRSWSASSRSSSSSRAEIESWILLTVAGAAAQVAVRLTADEPATGGLTINLFWIIVRALNFIVFFALF